MFSRASIHEGMPVYSSDGERLGKVIAIDDDEFHIEKGLFFHRDYLARFADIREITDGALYLSRDKASLQPGGSWADDSVSARGSTARRGARSAFGASFQDERTMLGSPLASGDAQRRAEDDLLEESTGTAGLSASYGEDEDVRR